MRKISWKEYLLWDEYLSEKNFNPDKTDYYLMQLTAYLEAVNSTKRKRIKIDDYLIDFKPNPKDQTSNKPSSRAIWTAILKQSLGEKKPDGNSRKPSH